MKKLITISLFIFWALVVAILTAGLVFYQNNKNTADRPYQNYLAGNNSSITSGGSADANLSGNQSSTPAMQNLGQVITLSLTEIAKHNKASDCWLLINNKVYSVSSYLSSHPGGAGTIIPNCGKEATQLFNTKGSKDPHSANANSMLADYYVGELNQVFNNNQGSGSSLSALPIVVNSKPTTGVPPVNTGSNINNSSSNQSATTSILALTLNMTEIAKHNKSSDCWLLVNNKVYNVSSYISAHPGGSGTIIPNCGKESTQLYNTKGGNKPHSGNANNMLAAYYVGNLNQQTSQQQVQQTVQNTNTIVPPQNSGGDDEGGEDDENGWDD